MTQALTRKAGCAIAATCSVLLAGAASAATRQEAYFIPVNTGYDDAQLVTWKGADRARLVRVDGAQWGSVATNGSQKLVTLDAPLSTITYAGQLDSCGEQPQVRRDVLQVLYRKVSAAKRQGQAEIVDMGTETVLDGCDAGQVKSFGSLDDPGKPEQYVDMADRPPVADLTAGSSLAGLSEKPFDGFGQTMAVDIVSLLSDTQLQFGSSRNVYGYTWTSDRWLQVSGSGLTRAFTRLTVDAKSGAEVWLSGDGVAGQLSRLWRTWVVKPTVDASFGSVRQAARMWASGYFVDSPYPLFFYLYGDQSGQMVMKDLAQGTESRSPIAHWEISGNNLVQSYGKRVRTWQPVATSGRHHFALESVDMVLADGSRSPLILPRLNDFIDTGKAVPPAQAAGTTGALRGAAQAK